MSNQDDLDALLDGGEQSATDGSQPELTNDASHSGQQINATEGQEPEEVAWRNLKGSTQDRIRSLLKERDDLRQKVTMVQPQQPVLPPAPPLDTPEIKQAISRLEGYGLATKESVQKVIDETLSGLVRYNELEKLESRYDGSDGRPKFTREEYSDFTAKHPEYRGYQPEDVYRKMYNEELLDWEISHKSAGKRSTPLKPTSSGMQRESSLDLDQLEEKMSNMSPDERVKYYEANQDKINRLLARTATE